MTSAVLTLRFPATAASPYNEEIVVVSSLNIRNKDKKREKRQFGGGWEKILKPIFSGFFFHWFFEFVISLDASLSGVNFNFKHFSTITSDAIRHMTKIDSGFDNVKYFSRTVKPVLYLLITFWRSTTFVCVSTEIFALIHKTLNSPWKPQTMVNPSST